MLRPAVHIANAPNFNIPNPLNQNTKTTITNTTICIIGFVINVRMMEDPDHSAVALGLQSQEVTWNLNTLQLALSGAPRPSKPAPININTSSGSHQSRARSTSLSTVNELISFPLSVPKSAICHQTELRFSSARNGNEDSLWMRRCFPIRRSFVK